MAGSRIQWSADPTHPCNNRTETDPGLGQHFAGGNSWRGILSVIYIRGVARPVWNDKPNGHKRSADTSNICEVIRIIDSIKTIAAPRPLISAANLNKKGENEMGEELTKEQMQAVIKKQLFDWQMARYDAEVQVRVQKRIGGDAETLKNLTERLALCERALDALQEELTKLA